MTFYGDGPLMEAEQRGIHELPLSTGRYVGESFQRGLEETPTAQSLRALEVLGAKGQPEDADITDPMSGAVIGRLPARPVEKIPVEEAQRRVKEANLERQIDLGKRTEIEAPALDIMMDHARARAHREAQIARGPSGVLPGVAATGASFFAGALDPLSLAAFSVPVVGEARMASLMASAGESILGRAAVRGGIGAAQGAVGMTALQPIEALAHSIDGRDFGFADALTNIAAGAGLGGVLHAGGGGIADIWRGYRGTPLYPFGPGEPFARTPGAPPPAAPGAAPPPTPSLPPAPARVPGAPLPAGAYPQVEALLAHPEVRNQPPNERLNFTLDDVLNTPHVADAIEHPQIEREHDVPFGSAASATIGTHVDRNVPESATIGGVTFDPAIPANVARHVEREAIERMQQQFRDSKGREPNDREVEKIINFARKNFATPAEKAWVTGRGIDWDKYQDAWKEWHGKIDHENPVNPPSGLYATPLPPRLREKVAKGEAAVPEAAQPEPPQPVAAPAPPTDTTGLAQMGGDMGRGIADSLHQHLWDRVQAGEVTETRGMPPSALLQAAKMIRSRGGLQTFDQYKAFADDYGRSIHAGTPTFQQDMRALVERHAPAEPVPIEAPPVPAKASSGVETIAKAIQALKPFQSRWVDVPEGRIYLRRSTHPDIGETIDIPNIEFEEEARGQGAFKRYLAEIERQVQLQGLDAVYVENIFNKRLASFLRRRGYQEEGIVGGGPMLAGLGKQDQPSLYKRFFNDRYFEPESPHVLTNGRSPETDAEKYAADALASGNNKHSGALRELSELIGIKQRFGEDISKHSEAADILRQWAREGVSLKGEMVLSEDARERLEATPSPIEEAIQTPAAEEPTGPAVNPATGTDEILPPVESQEVLKGAVASLMEGKPVRAGEQIDGAKAEPEAPAETPAPSTPEGPLVDRLADELATIYREKGRQSANDRFNEILGQRRWSDAEIGVLKDRFRERIGEQAFGRETGEVPSAPAPVEQAAPTSLADHFRDYFLGSPDFLDKHSAYLEEGKRFSTIVQARRFAKDMGFGEDTKAIDEAIEHGAVQAARAIAGGEGADADKFAELVKLYDRQPRLSTRTSTSMRDQAYSTPVPLAYVASRLGRVETALRGGGGRVVQDEVRKAFPDVQPEADHFLLPIEADREPAGYLQFAVDAKGVEIKGSYIESDYRGRGLGVSSYERVADWALSSGRELRSDSELNADGARIYAALERRGYTVERNPSNEIDARGNVKASDGKSAFTIVDKTGVPRTTGKPVKPRIYEPSAGNGALLMEVDPPNYAVANEINPSRAKALREQGFRVTERDASDPAQGRDLRHNGGVDVVLANPPFGPIKEGKGSKVFDLSDIQTGYSTHEIDHAIALRALEAMKDDGRGVLLIGGINKLAKTAEARSDAYNAKAKREFFKVLFDRYTVTDMFTVAGELYERQGAGWPIDVVVIAGRGRSSRGLPAVNPPRVLSSWDEVGKVLNEARRTQDAGPAGGAPGGPPVALAPEAPRVPDAGGGALVAGGGAPGGIAPQGRPEDVRGGPVPREPGNLPAGAAGAPEGAGQPQLEPGLGDTGRPGGEPAAERPSPGVGLPADVQVRTALSEGNHQTQGIYRAIAETTETGGLRVVGYGETANEADAAARQALAERLAQRAEAQSEEPLPPITSAEQAAAEATKEALEPQLAPEQPKVKPRVIKSETETGSQVAYTPQSTRTEGLGTLVPVNMKKSIADSLEGVEKRRGDIDNFVASELGYSVEEMSSRFAAEQVDALALALDNIKQNKGFIIGDQTGIGKGRVNAGIIRWAIRNKRIPVFVTEKPNLYGDMYRDLTDIGLSDMLEREPRFLMTNAGQDVPLSEDGKLRLKTPPPAAHNAMLLGLPHDAVDFLKEYDAVFTNYSQMQTVAEQDTPRRAFLRAIAPDSVVIFDESHNAGGQKSERGPKGPPDRAGFARELVRQAKGVFYSSATYAKRPDVMDLYSKTDMAMAVADPKDLGEAIAKGGVPMQQAVASMLARAGQYIRRERSFAGVEYNTPAVAVERATYDGISRALNAVNLFSKVVERAAESIDSDLKASAGGLGRDASVGDVGAKSTNFTSIMHNVVGQVLLALKAKPAARMAIEALERGEKPVITVAGTMEAFLKDFAENMDIKPGDPVTADFGHVIKKYLDRTRTLIIKKPFAKKGESERKYLSDAELGPMGVRAYSAAKEMIDKLDLKDLPISPIDAIKSELTKAGYRVGEITGRGTIIDYSGKRPILKPRPGAEVTIKGRAETIRRFNGGTADKPLPKDQVYDAMVLNQAGATGLSLHASGKFGEQAQRHMFVAQPEANIDTHMQLLGRIHRTGQVVLPKYSQLIADIPAEKRPAAVLAKKMASLNANTTAARGSAMTAKDVPDFMNAYGDMVAAALIQESPEMNARLGHPVKFSDTGRVEAEDAMRKLTGRIPLLPLKEQEALYGYLETEYHSLLEQMKAAGENALEAQTLDLRAQTVERREVVARKTASDSPFAAPVQVERVMAKRLGKPFKSDEVVSKVLEGLGETAHQNVTADNASRMLENVSNTSTPAGKRAAERHEAQATEAVARFESYKRGILDEIDTPERQEQERAKQDAYKDRWTEMQEMLPPGQRVVLKTANGNLTGVVLKVEQKGKPKNPLALSTWKADIAIADATKRIELPFSRLYQEGTADSEDALAIEVGHITDWLETKQKTLDRFDSQQSDAREERYIATGNLLAAYDWLNRKGRVVNYTDEAGHTRQGILTPRDFDLEEFAASNKVPIGDENAVMQWLEAHPGHDLSTPDDVVKISLYKGNARISVAGAKRLGGDFYLDRKLTSIVGDFSKAGNRMIVDTPAAKLLPAIKRIQDDLGPKFQAVKALAAPEAGPARPAPTMTREQAWDALSSEPLPHEERAAVETSRAAETAEEPASAAQEPKARQTAAAKAEQDTAAQVAQASEYISEEERAAMERALQEHDQEQVSRAQVIREGIACFTVGGINKEKP